jgi:ADP-ribose pyrophosphatase YjhB (NUDIX family)
MYFMQKTYCVSTAIIKDDEKYFIAKRSLAKKIKPGLWEFITGFVEDHEAAEDTILREITEEINASGKIEKRLEILQFQDEEERWIVIPFLASIEVLDIKITPEEHSEGNWVTLNELLNIPQSEFRYNLDEIRKILS